MKLKELLHNQILTEVNQQDVVFSHKNRAVVDTNHAVQRFNERTTQPREYYHKFFANMIDRILKIEQSKITVSKNHIMPEEIFVFSPTYNQGMVVAYRRDKFDKMDPTKHFYIITIYPVGSTKPVYKNTFKTLIESKHQIPIIKIA